MNYLSQIRELNPQLADYTDDEIVYSLPTLDPERFGNKPISQVRAEATLTQDQLQDWNDSKYGVLDAVVSGGKRMAGNIGLTLDSWQGDTTEAQQGVEALNQIQSTPQQKRFQQALAEDKGEGWIDSAVNIASAIYEEPEGFFHEMASQTANMVPQLGGMVAGGKVGALAGSVFGPAGAAVGGVIGSLGGAILGATSIETGAMLSEKANENGGLVTGELMSEANQEGAVKGAVIGSVDRAMMGLGSFIQNGPGRAAMNDGIKVLMDAGVDTTSRAAVSQALKDSTIKKALTTAVTTRLDEVNTLARRTGRNLATLMTETAGEVGGEYLGSLAATGEASAQDALLEGFMSLGQSGVQTVMARDTTSPEIITSNILARANNNIDAAGQRVADAGGDALSQETAQAQAAATEIPNAITTVDQIAPKPDYSGLDTPASQRASAPRESTDLDRMITIAERSGFDEEAVRLRNARALLNRANNTDKPEVAQNYRDRANKIITEVSGADAESRRTPYVYNGELMGGDVAPYQQQPTGNIYDQPRNFGGRPAQIGQDFNRLNAEGTIYGAEPEWSAEQRQRAEMEREQRQADDFSARYGQEGTTPLRQGTLSGQFVPREAIIDEDRQLPNQSRPTPRLANNRMGQLPPGDGRIYAGQETNDGQINLQPEDTRIGRNVVERQAQAQPNGLPAPRTTITQTEYIDAEQRYRQAIRVPVSRRTIEQIEAISVVTGVRTGKIMVAEAPNYSQTNLQANTETDLPLPPTVQADVDAREAAIQAEQNRQADIAQRRSEAAKRRYYAPVSDTDDLLAAIAKSGGINRQEAIEQGFDESMLNVRAGGRPVFPVNGGNSVDGMAETLAQTGHVRDDADTRNPDLMDKLTRSINGGETIRTPEGEIKYQEQLLQAQERMAGPITSIEQDSTTDEEWLGVLYSRLVDAGVAPSNVDYIIENSADSFDAAINLRKLYDEQLQTRSGAADRTATTEGPELFGEGQAFTDADAADLWGDDWNAEEGFLTSYTEQDLQARDDDLAAAQQADALEQQRLEQRAQADAEVNDFALTGSNRPADIAVSAGQNDMFGLGATPRNDPAAEQAETPRQAAERIYRNYIESNDNPREANESLLDAAMTEAQGISDDVLYETLRMFRRDNAARRPVNELFDQVSAFFTDSDNKLLAVMAENSQRRLQGDDFKESLMIKHQNDLTGVQMVSRDGERGALFLPDASEPGRFRASYFDKRGFYGHTTRDTYQQVLDEAWIDGFREETTGMLERMMVTDEFSRGNQITSLMARVNEGQITHAEYVQLAREIAGEGAATDQQSAPQQQAEPVKPSELPPQSTEQASVNPEFTTESEVETAKEVVTLPNPAESAVQATDALNTAISNGQTVTADNVREVFEYIAGNREAVTAELKKLTKDQLKRLVRGVVYSDTKKAELVEMAYKDMIGDFRFIGNNDTFITTTGFGFDNYLKQAREHVNSLTDERIAQYATDRKAAIDERVEQRRQKIDKLKNPQTIEDFRETIRTLGADQLTTEQRTRFDRLVAEEAMTRQSTTTERAGLQTDETIELGEPVESVHGKTGETIFNVKVISRLGKEKFKEAANFARSMKGGYYRGNFYFKSREDAELFSGWVNGESVDLSSQAETKEAERQSKKANNLKAMADRLEEQGYAELNAERRENTGKRMREADSARNKAAKDIRIAEVTRRIADSDSPLLKGVNQKIQVELLERLANSLKYSADDSLLERDRFSRVEFKKGVPVAEQVASARMPLRDMYVGIGNQLAEKMQKTKGFVLHGRRLQSKLKGKKSNEVVVLDDSIVQKIVEYADKHAEQYDSIKDIAADYKRLARMGVTNRQTLRAVLMEYMELGKGAGPSLEQNTLQTMERELQRTVVGNRNAFNDFFPTPEATAQEIIDQAEIEPGMRVLEPSAGNGMLADAAKSAGAEVDVVEMGGQLREILSAKGYSLVGDDFLDYKPEQAYDRIVMNPPFSNDQDIQHVRHAYSMLKPGGKLVAIVSGPAGDRSNKTNKQFREWLDDLAADEQQLPEGAFKSSLNPTSVNTKVIVIDKPLDAPVDLADSTPLFRLASTVTDETTGATQGKGVTLAEAEAIAQEFMDSYNGNVPLEVMVRATQEEIYGPNGSKTQIGTVKGAYHPERGVFTLAANNLQNRADTQETIRHEVLGHYGLNTFKPDDKQAILQKILDSKAALKDEWSYVGRVYSDKDQMTQAEEVFAKIAEEQRTGTQQVFDQILALVNKALRKVGLAKGPVSRSELRRLVDTISKEIRSGERTQQTFPDSDTAQYSRSGEASSIGQTNTDAFRNWFGDSKVVDENGEPLVVYHGTIGDFSEFSMKEYGTNFTGDYGIGFYFTQDPKVASGYADSADFIAGHKSGESGGANVMPVYLKMENPLIVKKSFGTGDLWKKVPGAKTKQELTDGLISQGYDGVIVDGGRAGYRYISEAVVFNPNQIKSATGNNGDFDPANPDILFRRDDADQDGAFAAPTESLKTAAITRFVDKFKVLKDLQKNIQAAGGKITDSNNAYVAEELFHGKAEEDLRQMEVNYVEPLAKKMAQYGITQKDLDDYLYARHAEERNIQIAKINDAMPDGGSGMTTETARRKLAGYESSPKADQYRELSGIVDDMLATRRKILVENGFTDQGEIDAWESTYQHYVPLKGKADDEPASPRTGRGFNNGRSRESQRAMGRSSEATSPLLNTINDLTETLIRARKNEVGNAFLELAEDNPNSDYWQVFTEDDPEIARAIQGYKEGDKVIWKNVPMGLFADNYFITKRDGKRYFIKLSDDRMMRALKNVGVEEVGQVVRFMGGITRFLSTMNTSYNPEFVIGNFARDVQTAILNLSAEQTGSDGKAKGKKIAAKTVKDIPVAMKAVWRGLRNKPGNSEYDQYFQEFREAGAKTGYFDMKDLDGQQKELENLIAIAQGGYKGKALDWFRSARDFVEDMNGAVENAVRLSAYTNARKAGISQTQAASLAKNMTVNFNRRGEAGTLLNSLYMFANASIQGSVNFVRTMGMLKGDKNDPIYKRLTTAQKMAGAMIVGSYALAAMNRAGAGEDDDGENWFDKVPDYEKERNIIVMKSLFGGEEGEYYKIPLPYGYNVFSVLGNSVEAVTNGQGDVSENAARLTLAIAGSFSPIGFQDSKTMEGLLLKNLAPTLAKPVVDIGLNENFMGTPIYQENFPFGTPKPESSLSRRSTPEFYKSLAEGLNEITGGSLYRSGWLDVNPDVMRYVVNFIGGASGNFALNKVPDAAIKGLNGVEMEARQIPFVSRVMGRVMPYDDMGSFYDRRDEINQFDKELKALSGSERMAFYRENRSILSLRSQIKPVESKLKALRKQRDRIYENESLSMAERDTKLKEIEARMKAVVDRFNLTYNRAMAD